MSLRFPFNGTMLGGIRKFCDYHLISQFLFQGIIDVFAYSLIITPEQICQLLTCQPDHVILQTNIYLCLTVLCLIYDDFTLFHK